METTLLKETLSYLKQELEEGRRFVYSEADPPAPKEERWALHSPPPLPQTSGAEEMLSLIALLPIVLGYFEEVESHRLFLEKVARAVTDAVAPARVVKLSDGLPRCSLLVAPIEGHEPHQLTEVNNQPLLPLYPIERYLDDISLKRALWNVLKQLPKSFSIAR